jgi:hypothetical protein
MSAILDALLTVLDEEHAHAIVEYRRVTIKKPLTAFGAKILAKKLSAWGDANEAAEIMIDKCWQGFDTSWVRDRRQPQHTGRRNFVDVAMDRLKVIQ